MLELVSGRWVLVSTRIRPAAPGAKSGLGHEAGLRVLRLLWPEQQEGQIQRLF